jgi:glycosyltransferase involved in cell wall biosynthesis
MSANKIILLFTDWYEPGYKAGGPIRSCHNIVQAFFSEFRFYIVTSDRDLGDTAPYPGVIADSWTDAEPGVKIYYSSPESLTNRVIAGMLRDIRPAVVYLNSMFSPIFTLRPLWVIWKMKLQVRLILAPRGMLKASALAQKKWKKKAFLKFFTVSGMRSRVVFHATDDQEKTEILQQFGPVTRVVVASNLPGVAHEPAKRIKAENELKIVFLSRIHPIKNLLFGLELMQDLKPSRQISFDIYGYIGDDNYYQRCFEAARRLENKVDVQFLGEVEHSEVEEVLQRYHLFFLPTRGENFGHAIFEALASGCPVLISDQTPWKGLEEAGAGWAIPLSEPGKFISAIERLYAMSQMEFDESSAQAVQFAEKHVSEFALRENYFALFEGK